jgi:hypothetical protein
MALGDAGGTGIGTAFLTPHPALRAVDWLVGKEADKSDF